jgi:hypothetical protein
VPGRPFGYIPRVPVEPLPRRGAAQGERPAAKIDLAIADKAEIAGAAGERSTGTIAQVTRGIDAVETVIVNAIGPGRRRGVRRTPRCPVGDASLQPETWPRLEAPTERGGLRRKRGAGAEGNEETQTMEGRHLHDVRE